MADVSFAAGTIGLGIPFVLLSGTTLFSGADAAAVTWLNDDGSRRSLSLASAGSAEFTWTTSAAEFRTPARLVGQLLVSLGTGTFYTSSFTVAVHPTVLRMTTE